MDIPSGPANVPDLLIVPWPAASRPAHVISRYQCERCGEDTVERGELRRNAVCNVYDVDARRFCGGALTLVARERVTPAPKQPCSSCGALSLFATCADCTATEAGL